METLWWIFRIWLNCPAQTLLYGSFLVHYGLSLWALWQRRSLRLRSIGACSDHLGFAIPIPLARHVVGYPIADILVATPTPVTTPACFGSISYVRPENGYLADAGPGGRLGRMR